MKLTKRALYLGTLPLAVALAGAVIAGYFSFKDRALTPNDFVPTVVVSSAHSRKPEYSEEFVPSENRIPATQNSDSHRLEDLVIGSISPNYQPTELNIRESGVNLRIPDLFRVSSSDGRNLTLLAALNSRSSFSVETNNALLSFYRHADPLKRMDKTLDVLQVISKVGSLSYTFPPSPEQEGSIGALFSLDFFVFKKGDYLSLIQPARNIDFVNPVFLDYVDLILKYGEHIQPESIVLHSALPHEDSFLEYRWPVLKRALSATVASVIKNRTQQ